MKLAIQLCRVIQKHCLAIVLRENKGLIGTNQACFLLIWLASVFPKFQEALTFFTSLHLLMQLCKSKKGISSGNY
jgi:hypothetical protein